MHSRPPLLSLAALAAVSLLLFMLTVVPSASAQYFRVEAEGYIAQEDHPPGILGPSECPYASGGFAVDGMDPGDWIELQVLVPEAGLWSDSLRSAGDVGLVRGWRLEVFNGFGDPVDSDEVETAPGQGAT
jgi:hypothetical protein